MLLQQAASALLGSAGYGAGRHFQLQCFRRGRALVDLFITSRVSAILGSAYLEIA
jgi:hypothetical protein